MTCFLKEIVFILMISGSAQLGFSFSLHGFDMIEEGGGLVAAEQDWRVQEGFTQMPDILARNLGRQGSAGLSSPSLSGVQASPSSLSPTTWTSDSTGQACKKQGASCQTWI